MPRVDLRTKYEKESEEIRLTVISGIERSGYHNKRKLAKKTSMSYSTLMRHLSNLDGMKVGDFRKLANTIGLRVKIERIEENN